MVDEAEEAEECPYCKLRVRRLSRHIELRHREFTTRHFLRESKVALLLTLLLLAGLVLVLIPVDLTIGGVALETVVMGLAVVVGGVPLVREGIRALVRERTFEVDILVVVAAIGAMAINYWSEAAVLIYLFTLAETLESYSVFRNRGTLKDLLDLSPAIARLEKDGSIVEVPVETLEIGDIVQVRPGEGIPVDGEVVEGHSTVNQAPITGESIPVHRGRGDIVFSGTLNGEGLLRVRMTKRSADFTLSRIVDLIEEEGPKARTELFVNRFAAYYTPIMIVLALLIFLIPVLMGMEPREWLYRALTLLVISCPCAFVISTPVTMFSTITSSARKGALIKGGAYIEALRDTDIFVFDKTGTLTRGEPEMTDVIALDGMPREEILGLAASLEVGSAHPLATPIVTGCRQEGCEMTEVDDLTSLAGRGIEGRIRGVRYTLGSPEMLSLNGLPASEVQRLSAEGKTVVVLAEELRPIGLIAVKDVPREEAKGVIGELRQRGIWTVMLTGDNEGTARAVAEELGLDEYRASLLPKDKLEEVERLKTRGRVTMVGDGVNDAPALVRSDVGIAMGAAGSDTALEAAHMALMEDDLSKIIDLLDLSERTMRVVKANVYSSLAVKAALVALTLPGMVTLWMAVAIGDMGMSLLVTLNALLLSRR